VEEHRIRTLIEPYVVDEDYDLVAVQLLVVDGRRTLRVSIDRQGGVNIQHCTRVSHLLSPILDAEDPVSGAYNLEVSSPGMERPVQKPSDFERFAGYRARLRMARGSARQRYTCTLRGLDGDSVRVEADGQTFLLRLEDIERATLLLTLEEYRVISGFEGEESLP